MAVTTEVVATHTNIQYDPVTKDALITFTVKDVFYVDGECKSVPAEGRVVHVRASEVATDKLGPFLTDPVTGQSLANVSVAGIMALVKAAVLVYDAAERDRQVA